MQKRLASPGNSVVGDERIWYAEILMEARALGPAALPSCHGRTDSEAHVTLVQYNVINAFIFASKKHDTMVLGSVCAPREHSERRGTIT
jgi:hypothetical protein